ncbi:MAG: MFS transporter [Proteobacteria bacterium]|nr:MFS transporter [Pseudomonadota bacterium]
MGRDSHKGRWAVFGICASLFMMSMLYRASGAVIAPDLSRDLDLGPEDLGLLGALFFYGFGLVQFPLGLFLDRIGGRRTMIALNLIGVLGAGVFAQAGGLAAGLVGRGLLGVGMSANMMGSLKLYTQWFKPQEFATISGLMLAVGSLGSLMATSPLRLLTDAAGWRIAFIMLGLLNLVLVAVLVIFVNERPPGETAEGPPSGESAGPSGLAAVKVLFRDLSYWSIALTAGLRYGVYAAIQTLWAGPFLMIHLGLAPLTAGNLMLALSVGFILGAPVGGLVADRFSRSRKKTVLYGMVLLTATVLILAKWPGPVMLPLLGLTLFAFGFFGAFGQVMYAHIKDLMPAHMSGTAMAGVNFFTIFGAGVFLQTLGGVLANGAGKGLEAGGDYPGAFMFCFYALLAGTAIYAASRDARVGPNP